MSDLDGASNDGLYPGQIARFEEAIQAIGDDKLTAMWTPIRQAFGKTRRKAERLEREALSRPAPQDLEIPELRGEEAMKAFFGKLTLRDLENFKSAAMVRGDPGFIRLLADIAEKMELREISGATVIFIEPHPDEVPNAGSALSYVPHPAPPDASAR